MTVHGMENTVHRMKPDLSSTMAGPTLAKPNASEAASATTGGGTVPGGIAAGCVPPAAAGCAPRGGTVLARARQECGDYAIRIGRDGTWYYKGSAIQRKPMVCLFASILKRGGGRRLLAGNAGRARPDRGRGRPLRRGRAVLARLRLRRRRAAAMPDLPHQPRRDGHRRRATTRSACSSARERASRGPTSRSAPASRPASAARCSTNWWRWPNREMLEGREVLGVWSEGTFFPIDEMPTLDLAAD